MRNEILFNVEFNGHKYTGLGEVTSTRTYVTEHVYIIEGDYDQVGYGKDKWMNRPWYRFKFANALERAVISWFGRQAYDKIERAVNSSSNCQEAMDKFFDSWNDSEDFDESLEEDIADDDIDKVYKKLSRLNKVDFGALEDEYLKARPSVKDAVYKFYGTILNTKRHCKDFAQWAKEEKSIDLKGLPCGQKNEGCGKLNEKSDYNALRRAKEFIKNATTKVNFYGKIRDILKDADIEDWDIKNLQRLADAKYAELESTDVVESCRPRKNRKLKEARERHIKDLSHEELLKLRKEISLGSLYYRDYDNSFGIDEHEVCDFFDGFLDDAEDRYKEETGKYPKDIGVIYDKYDNPDDLFYYFDGIDWGVDESLKKAPSKRKAMFVKEEKKCESIGSDISEYQKWVDYDMEKYGKISGDTMKKVREAGLSITKDQYGDYEVIAYRK